MPSNLKRYQTEGSYHFITFSCYHRKPFLNSDHARIVFEETLERLRQRHDFYVFGYVLMPEHVHLLISSQLLAPHRRMPRLRAADELRRESDGKISRRRYVSEKQES